MTAAVRETEWERRQRRTRERAEHVAAHGPACELCGNVPRRGLDEDHDHRTGQHRGWLCHRCNRALPSWVVPEWLRRAADYLDERTVASSPASTWKPSGHAPMRKTPGGYSCDRHGAPSAPKRLTDRQAAA